MLNRRAAVPVQPAGGAVAGTALGTLPGTLSGGTSRGLSLVCLLLVAVIWGSTLALIKETAATVPFPLLLFVRFSVALLLLSWVRPTRAALRPSTVLGLLLLACYATQSLGVHLGSAARSGFLMGLTVVVTPLLSNLLFRRRSSPLLYLSAGLVVLSVGLMGDLSWYRLALGRGDLLVLASALLFSLYGVLLAEVSRYHQAFTLSAMQLYPMVLVSGVWAAPSLDTLPELTPGNWLALVYLAAVATVLVLLLWSWASRRVAAGEAALVYALEPLAGALFAYLLVGEVPGSGVWYGGGVMIFALLLASFGQLRGARRKPSGAAPDERLALQSGKRSFDEP